MRSLQSISLSRFPLPFPTQIRSIKYSWRFWEHYNWNWNWNTRQCALSILVILSMSVRCAPLEVVSMHTMAIPGVEIRKFGGEYFEGSQGRCRGLLYRRVPRRALPIHLFRQCTELQTDRQRDPRVTEINEYANSRSYRVQYERINFIMT